MTIWASGITGLSLRLRENRLLFFRHSYGSGFIGLLPGYSGCGGNRKLAPEVSNLIEEVLKTHYDTVKRSLKRGAYGEYVLQSQERHLKPACQSTDLVTMPSIT